jgi:hypothetical protein
MFCVQLPKCKNNIKLISMCFYAYPLQTAQQLSPGDHPKCVRFCEWLQPLLQILSDILTGMLLTLPGMVLPTE